MKDIPNYVHWQTPRSKELHRKPIWEKSWFTMAELNKKPQDNLGSSIMSSQEHQEFLTNPFSICSIMQPVGLANAHFAWVIVSTQLLLHVAMYSAGIVFSAFLLLSMYGLLSLSSSLWCDPCRNCITEWCNEKPECPLCRTPITHSSLVCVYHSDF